MTMFESPDSLCEVSFIIPAHDEAAFIGSCLDAIRRAAMANRVSFEIIVADDGSADDTARVARQRGARVVDVDARHASRARNAGAEVARGKVLCFVDADTCIDAAVLGGTLAAIAGGAVGGGAVFRYAPPVPTTGRILEHLAATVFRWLNLPAGSFVFARRTAFEAAGGFDPWLFAAEEWALCRALSRRGPTVILNQPVVTSAREFERMRASDVVALVWRAFRRGPRVALRQRDLFDAWATRGRQKAHTSI